MIKLLGKSWLLSMQMEKASLTQDDTVGSDKIPARSASEWSYALSDHSLALRAGIENDVQIPFRSESSRLLRKK